MSLHFLSATGNTEATPTVVSVDSIQPASNKRAVTLITADYELGGGTVKRQQLNSRLVKLAEDNRTRDEIVQVVTALVNEQNNEPTNETNGDVKCPITGESAMKKCLQCCTVPTRSRRLQ